MFYRKKYFFSFILSCYLFTNSIIHSTPKIINSTENIITPKEYAYLIKHLNKELEHLKLQNNVYLLLIFFGGYATIKELKFILHGPRQEFSAFLMSFWKAGFTSYIMFEKQKIKKKIIELEKEKLRLIKKYNSIKK